MSNTRATATHEELEALWDANDVARYVKASRSWVYQRAEDGTLPSHRVCGLLRFEPAEVRAFVRGENRPAGVVPFHRRRDRV